MNIQQMSRILSNDLGQSTLGSKKWVMERLHDPEYVAEDRKRWPRPQKKKSLFVNDVTFMNLKAKSFRSLQKNLISYRWELNGT